MIHIANVLEQSKCSLNSREVFDNMFPTTKMFQLPTQLPMERRIHPKSVLGSATHIWFQSWLRAEFNFTITL